MVNSAKSTTGIVLHGLYNLLILGSCAILFGLVACEGPVGPQGPSGPRGYNGTAGAVGPQGDPGPVNGNVARIYGNLDSDGFAGFTIIKDADASWSGHMPVVNVWVRRFCNDPWVLIDAYDGMVVVTVKPDVTPLKEILIGFGIEGYAHWQYLVVIVFYEPTELSRA